MTLSLTALLSACGGGADSNDLAADTPASLPGGATEQTPATPSDIATPTAATSQGIGPQPVASTDLAQGTWFVKPNGSGTSCAKATPCDIWTAVGKAKAGNVVFLRGGVYAVSKNLTFNSQGSATAPVVFESYPGEQAILDGSQHAKGTSIYVRVSGKFIKLRKLEVRNMPLQGIWINGTDNVIEGVHAHHNGLTGIQVFSPYEAFPYGKYGSRNVIRHSIVNDNSGAGLGGVFNDGGNSDGISISSGANNRVEHNLVYHNSDDGIDTWRSTDSYVGYNIVHANGIGGGNGMGIKAGGKSPSKGTVAERNLAYGNRADGLTFNSGLDVKFLNNTAWNNKGVDYALGNITVAKNNISASGRATGGAGIASNNSWQRAGSVKFKSTDPTSPDFLVPTAGGGFEDIGAFAGMQTQTTATSKLPDVVVTGINYANGNFTATVKNQGTAPTPSGTAVTVGYSVDGTYRTWGAIDGTLAAGATATAKMSGGSFMIPDGQHTIKAHVDDVDRFKESNETNNTLTQTVTIGASQTPMPDVIVTSLSYANGKFSATIKNQGDAATPAGVTVAVGYSVDGQYRTWGAMDGALAAGASATIGTNGTAYTIADGTHEIKAHVDDVDRFKESDETNNTLTQQTTVGSTQKQLPDLVVTSLTYADGLFTSVVKNQGTAATPTGGTVAVGYLVDGQRRSGGTAAGALAAGASVTVKTDGGGYLIPSGEHTITAHADDVKQIEELNEANNQLAKTLTVGTTQTALPDVIVTSLNYANGKFSATIKNQGTKATPDGVKVTVAYSVDGQYRTWGGIAGSLAAGATATVGTDGAAYTIPSGTHEINAHVDDVNRFAESNEGNNELTQSISIGSSTSPTPSPSGKIGPQPVASTALSKGTLFVKNNGSGTACTNASPCDVWTAAGKAKAGDVVFLRGGVYPVSKNLTFNSQGSATAPV
ncbi:MAG: right-handed parallel beta-helix repeat-containing protein, partial [Pseudomonadaceae bacterium]|nr:right-handed parallel beta-helix repeat-containing protein [Pseudomonadaceae bacterium]